MKDHADRPVSVRRRDWDSISESEYLRVRAIWEGSFPAEERFDGDSVGRRASTWLWTVSAAGVGLIGFATAVLLARSSVAYLEYVAVSGSWRGGGTGAALLACVSEDLDAEEAIAGIVLEVEDPARIPDADPIVERRLSFYRRWGAHPLQGMREYWMPDLVNPVGKLPMLLLWRSVRSYSTPGAELIALLLTDLYLDYYADAAADGHLEDLLARIIGPSAELPNVQESA